ncbi:MAG: 50S rRNA methyltransferase [Oceanospirillum sp.]|nr:50S rRNA methyltransferase [Oceanospirillum sp.]
MEQLNVPQGQFFLSRYPVRKKENLRAWDAADEYILNYLAENDVDLSGNLLIINDSFGALTTALSEYQPTLITDSYLAQQGADYNLKHNNLKQNERFSDEIQLLDSLQQPTEPLDVALIKVPKSLSMLEEQLHRIRPFITENTVIIGAAMAKGIHNSTLKLFEQLIGPTTTSLAVKKARLIFSRLDADLSAPKNPYPLTMTLENCGFAHTQFELSNHANVFSREKLDIGTRFFLQNLPKEIPGNRIIDLGCGNGVVGLMAAERFPEAELTFVDESFMAVDSARINFQRAFPEREAHFKATDCLHGIPKSSTDLILNNPPFHQNNVVGDFIAQQMFRESRQVLKQGGELWVIGNRHLGYHVALKRLFGNCTTVASNKKFVILKAVKR